MHFIKKYFEENVKTAIFFMDTFSYAVVFHIQENDYKS